MTFNGTFFLGCVPVILLTAATGALAQQTPTIISLTPTSSTNSGAAPNGIDVTASELLFSQPYCTGMQTRGVYSVNIASPVSGSTSSLVSPIPDVNGVCSENYLAISPGLGGFTVNDTYASGVSTSNSSNEAVYKNGSTLFIDGLPASSHHAGVAFDKTGTFGNDLIVTLENDVRGYTAAGTLDFTYTVPSGGLYVLEGATVAPLTYGACPGCLYVTGELASNVSAVPPVGSGAVFSVKPGTPSGSALSVVATTPGPEPEGLVFVENSFASCSLDGYQYFVSGYATDGQIDNVHAVNGAILAFTPAQLSSYAGQFLVPNEGTQGSPGVISAFNGSTFSTFSNTGYQLEGSTILSCLGNGCPATFGFWKHHPFPASMFVSGSASIGCQKYTNAQLLAILNSNNAGGNAVTILGHQLIAAIANYDAGGKQTAAATAAIGSAVALLCSNNINMSTDFVASGTALGQQMNALADTLNTYNSSAPSCEGNGLATGNSN